MPKTKKKPVLPARGFATTSTPKKVEVKPEEPVIVEPDSAAVEASVDPATAATSASAEPTAETKLALDPEQEELQELADLYRSTTDKEISRIVKSVQYDRRFAKTFDTFAWPDPSLRRDTIARLRQQHAGKVAKRIPTADALDLLPKLLIVYGSLERLGVPARRIRECLHTIDTFEIDAAFEYLALHCDDGELSFDEAAPPTNSIAAIEPSSNGASTASSISPNSVPAVDPDAIRRRMVELDIALEAEREADDDPVGAWVRAKLCTRSLKKKGDPVDAAIADVLAKRMVAAGNSYFFDKKAADSAYKAELARLDARDTADRLHRAAETKDAARAEPITPAEPAPTGEAPPATAEEGGMFGALLDEPSTSVEVAPGLTIPVRSLPIPRSFSGKTPRALLEDLVRRRDKFATVSFIPLVQSGASRSSVTIRWSGSAAQRFEMHDEATPTDAEAVNYVATLALFDLSDSPVHRLLAPSCYELWTELEARKNDRADQAYRDHIKLVRDIAVARAAPTVLEDWADESAAAPPEEPNGASTPKLNGDADSYMPRARRAPVEFAERQRSPQYQAMGEQRMSLPIFAARQDIISTVQSNQCLILCGETGSGKSTQLPQYLCEHALQQGQDIKIVCAEPRRISAISLAQRVSQEMADPRGVGGQGSLVGYSIRGESKTSSSTILTYATTGVVLRMLEGKLDATHIIIDEVHERGIDSDFLLLALREMLATQPHLRLILMSATIDATRFSDYLGGCPVLNVPGRTFPVQTMWLEDAIEMTRYLLDEKTDSPYVRRQPLRGGAARLADADDSSDEAEDTEAKPDVARYRPATLKTLEWIDQSVVNFDLIFFMLECICLTEPSLHPYSQAILIFLPSLETIRRCIDILETHPQFGTRQFRILGLHSTVSSEAQSYVFERPPPGVRKIIVSSNIAETGVTIPDVTCVIDSGRHKEMRYNEKKQLSKLTEVFVAQANAKQRRGRAGRVQSGLCVHMISRARYEALPEHSTPELLRLSLQSTVLRISSLGLHGEGTIESMLARALDPPSTQNVQRAISSLVEIKALTQYGDITSLGRALARLPTDVHLGLLVLIGCHFACTDAVLTIAAALSSKSVFVAPIGKEGQADAAKRAFATAHSDPITVFRVYCAWRQACIEGTHLAFCRRNFCSHATLTQIEDMRAQLWNGLVDSGIVPRQHSSSSYTSSKARIRFIRPPEALDTFSHDHSIVAAVYALAMYPKLLATAGNGLQTLQNGAACAPHPSSVNFGHARRSDLEGASYLAFFNLVQSKRLYAQETSAIPHILPVIAFAGDADVKISAGSISVDRKLRMRVDPISALALKHLRSAHARSFGQRLAGKHAAVDEQWQALVARALVPSIEDSTSTAQTEKPKTTLRLVRAQ